MTSTTIAVRKDVYKTLLEVKCNLMKKAGKELSFSDVVVILCDYWNKNEKC